jgi:hypothetical protein
VQGFVPVTKQALLTMVDLCKVAVLEQVELETTKLVNKLVKQEIARSSTRRWYRLFYIPKSRFAYDTESVKVFASRQDYPMFEGNPFMGIDRDAINSYKWLNNLKAIADSNYSGEPITIDIKTFSRLSDPSKYWWANPNMFYYSVN